MPVYLDNVVPLGRSLDEYQRMFSLSPDDLSKTIIGVGDGPASFNAEMRALGRTIVSVDPLYVLSAKEIETRFYAVVDDVFDQVKSSLDDWVWSYHQSPDDLKQNRIRALNAFLADYEIGKADGRYVIGELPRLSFEDGKFDLALCSHFLFLYSDHLTYEFHRESVLELLRVASEVRVFPLLGLDLKESPHARPLMSALLSAGAEVCVETVNYELQRGGKQMVRIKK